jgi:hypothetical protein
VKVEQASNMPDRNRSTNTITPWARVVAGLLLGAVLYAGVLFVQSTLLGQRTAMRLSWYHAAFLIVFGIPFISAVASVAILGREPSFWRYLERSSAAHVLRPTGAVPGWRFTPWLRRLGPLVLGTLTSLYAILITASALDDVRTRVPILVFVWALTIGVLVALIRWWRVP